MRRAGKTKSGFQKRLSFTCRESVSRPLVFASSQYAPVKRDVVNELIYAIENEIGAIVLTGAGGEGKTTILMQLCSELHNAGKNVLYHAPTHKYDIPDNVIDGTFLVVLQTH